MTPSTQGHHPPMVSPPPPWRSLCSSRMSMATNCSSCVPCGSFILFTLFLLSSGPSEVVGGPHPPPQWPPECRQQNCSSCFLGIPEWPLPGKTRRLPVAGTNQQLLRIISSSSSSIIIIHSYKESVQGSGGRISLMTTFHLERIPLRPFLFLLNKHFSFSPSSSLVSESAYLPCEHLPVGFPTCRTREQKTTADLLHGTSWAVKVKEIRGELTRPPPLPLTIQGGWVQRA